MVMMSIKDNENKENRAQKESSETTETNNIMRVKLSMSQGYCECISSDIGKVALFSRHDKLDDE